MRRYLETLVQRLPWIIAALVIAPLVVSALSTDVLGMYQARAALWVESDAYPAPANPDRSTEDAIGYTGRLRQLLMTRTFRDRVLTGVIARGGVAPRGQAEHAALLDQIGTMEVASGGANLIEVEYRSRSPKLALATVSSAIEAFQSETLDTREKATTQASTRYQGQIRQAQDDAAMLRTRLSGLPTNASPDERAQLNLDLGAQSDLLKTLVDRQMAAYADSVTRLVDEPSVVQVIDPAEVDSRAQVSSIDLALAVTGAFLATVALCLVVVGIMTRLDRSVRTAADVRELTLVPVITTSRLVPPRDDGWPRLARRVFGTAGG